MMLAYLRLNDDFALFCEQGVGKTLPTILRILELIKSGKAYDALVVAPKAVIGSWWRDVALFPEADQKLLKERMTVVSYDIVWRRKEYQKHWSIIVLDESHKIKNHTTRRGKCLLQMALDSDYRFELTGTPISNGQLENIWSQFTFLQPVVAPRKQVYSKIFRGSYYDFLNRYAFLNQYHKPYRYRYVDELQDIISEHSYRVLKKDCLDLPDKLPDEVYDIELQEKKLYKELHNDSTVEDMDILATNPLTRMLRLRQVCSGFINDGASDKPLKCEKLTALEDFLDGWEKKLVVFCEFRRSIDSVVDLLHKLKIKCVVLDGRQQDKDIWKQFQSDESIRVIVCQYQSANAGIDLYAADTILYYEPTLSSNLLEQSRDRIHRIGQTHKCSYIHFLTTGTIEKAIYRALKGYTDFNDKLFTQYIQEYQKGVKC